jgi:hypothetical protein
MIIRRRLRGATSADLFALRLLRDRSWSCLQIAVGVVVEEFFGQG